MYTIGEVSELTGLPVSTLRYYDREGLFPGLERSSGIRRFMNWCAEGSATYPQRLELFEAQRRSVELELERLGRALDMLRFKCWYYSEAIKDGGEERLGSMQPEDMPEDIRGTYLRAHGL